MKTATWIRLSVAAGILLGALAVEHSALAQQTTKKKKKAKTATTTQAPAATNTPTAPSAAGEEPSTSSNEAFKFKVETREQTPSTENRPTMRFTDPGESAPGSKGPVFAETAPEEAPYKAYLGYPKHQLGVHVMPSQLSSTWKYSDQTYNFTDNPLVYGLDYRLVISPLFNLEFDYTHYSSSVTAASIKPYTINESKTTYDDIFARGHYCVVGRANFFMQVCPGVSIGDSAYPVLQFIDSTHLTLGKVSDVTLGADVAGQIPAGDHFLIKADVGYNYGTGIGNSGALTSKSNTSLSGNLGADWTITEHNTLEVLGVFALRTAKLSGKVGANDDTWNTNSTLLGARLAYLRTF